ncbi:MAG: hypothetical protein P0Y59_02740 [Candidatus Sphingomonas phytovorans]|nr:hypothetical protein [Sphingomonas sp.]WEK00629.1 MAG: hypothetical protein P0Y59_02740 [Sphingomonas sp.]
MTDSPRVAPPSLRLPSVPISGAQAGRLIDLADRLARLRADIDADVRETARRRNVARMIGGTDTPLALLGRTMAILPAATSAGPADARPIAASRENCPLCATRGDVGCRHQLPTEAR